MNQPNNQINNGMDDAENVTLDQIGERLQAVVGMIMSLPPHRSYSLAITKLEEAAHWLRDRKFKPANPPRGS